MVSFGSTSLRPYKSLLSRHVVVSGNMARFFDRYGWKFVDELGEKYGSVVKLMGPLGVGSIPMSLVGRTAYSSSSAQFYTCSTQRLYSISLWRISIRMSSLVLQRSKLFHDSQYQGIDTTQLFSCHYWIYSAEYYGWDFFVIIWSYNWTLSYQVKNTNNNEKYWTLPSLSLTWNRSHRFSIELYIQYVSFSPGNIRH